MDDSAFRKLGEQIKRNARGPIFDFAEDALRRLAGGGKRTECPVCAERRAKRTAAQKRWREKKRGRS